AVLEKHGSSTANLRLDWLKSIPLPWYSRRFAILSWLAPQWVPPKFRYEYDRPADASGWGPHIVRDLSPAGYQRAVARTRGEYESFLAWFQISASSAGPLLDLLQLSRKEGIPTALLLMPEGSDFRNFYPPFAWPKVQEFLVAVMREFGVPV